MTTVRVLLFIAAMFGVVTSAFGGAGVITTVVNPLTPAVTYGINATASPPRLALVTYVGYTVAIKNVGGNTVNHVRFTAATSVTDLQEKATFSSADGASCTASLDLTAIECTIGQLRAGESFPTFAVFFKAPVKITNGVADGVGEDRVKFSGITYYVEGTGGLNSPQQNSTTLWSAGAVTLGTSNATLVKSALPKGGGLFFTGDNAITSSTDRFAVSLTVPPAPTYSTVELRESDVSANINCRSLNHFVTCYQSAITIPRLVFSSTSGSYLTIILRVDAANIKPDTKISNVLIQYYDGDGVSVNIHNVGLCASPTTPRADGIPCIAKALYYQNKSVPGWTTELNGDFEWTLLNLKNGSYNLF